MNDGGALKTNEGYHADRTALSSSILKYLLTDFDKFYEVWVLNLPQPSKPQFVEGSLTHALLLEPEEVNKRYAFYTGLRRVGADYEKFAAENAGKEILLISTKLKAERSKKAVHDMPVALDLLQNCQYEQNMMGEVMGVKVKARADAINVEKGIVIDVKTSSYPSDSEIFKQTVKEFMYDLSASLYCQIAEQVYGKKFSFYWIVISKSDFQCHVYKASSDTLQFGSTLVMKALINYKKFLETNNSIDALRSTAYTNTTSMYEIIEV